MAGVEALLEVGADPYRERLQPVGQLAREEAAAAMARGEAAPLVASYDAMLQRAGSIFSKQMPEELLYSNAHAKYARNSDHRLCLSLCIVGRLVATI
jgi:hypothetical protein